MSQTDEKEYATGDNPNPFDEPADVPRKDDWQASFLNAREKQLEQAPWYPVAQGSPETQIPRRYRAFQVDEGDFSANVSPQRWDCTPAMAVPQSGQGVNAIEVVPFLPGRVHLEIINLGANPLLICPTVNEALNGRGLTIAAGASKAFDTQAAFWAYAVGGVSSVQAWWTVFEAPTSHLPPKDKES